MNFISASTHIDDVHLVGGKGWNLQRLISWKANVAPFFVINTHAHKCFTSTQKIPTEVEEEVLNFLKLHERIVFRSSMVGEDHSDASFAGMFDTVLGVSQSNWHESLKKIYASSQSQRVHEYLKLKKIKIDLRMAIVVQKEIQVEKSGVIFTRSPIDPTSAIAIDAAHGMGEGVVSGSADVEHYMLSRLGEIIISNSTSLKRVLNESELRELRIESLRLEELNQKPADIEWGFYQKKLYIFQIRPITRDFEDLKVFVDTNLAESYPGNVSPFTASFVRKAYENVFTESALILGAKGERLKTLSSHYAKLISRVDTHLYYNLEHYYSVLRSLPGGEKNIHNWHKMIGGDIADLKVPYHPTGLSPLETVQALLSLLTFALRKNKTYAQLLHQLEAESEGIYVERQNLKDAKSAMRYLSELIDRPLGFGVTVVNDVYIMMGLGYLTKLVKSKGLSEDKVIDLLKTQGAIDSIKPLTSFNHVAENLPQDFLTEFCKISDEPSFDPYSAAFQQLESQGWGKEVSILKNFINQFGDRSFEELKLESLPLKNDPELLKKLLFWGKNHQQNIAGPSESNISLELGAVDKFVLKFTRECIEMREASRLWRGRYYHLLREVMLKLISLLMDEDPSWKKYSIKDFFSLDHHEWLAFAEGSLSRNDVESFITGRRAWQSKAFSYPEIINWVPNERLPAFQIDHSQFSELKGQGVSSGIVTAKALVLERPTDALDSEMQDFILITKNTDPAWVYIMSRSRGLISEKGSLLSHTAIIGRELKIPTLVGVKSATHLIKTGDLICMDGSTGEIRKL